MKNYNKEIESLLANGRKMSEAEFKKYLDSYFTNKSDSEKEKIGEELLKVKLSKWEQIKKIDNEISFLTQLDGIESLLNLTQFSKRYFGKTKSWLFQRLHGWNVHGRPAKFTESEKKKFSEALILLSEDIRNVAQKLNN